MSVSITSRPEKTLPNGNLSKWNGSRTPLIYKFHSDVFPTNNQDSTLSITFIQQNTLNTRLTVSNLPIAFYSTGWYILIQGTSTALDGGYYKIKDLDTTNNYIFIETKAANFSGAATGTTLRYYKGYKVEARIYVGAPSYHTYYLDGSKPQYLAGVKEVDFGVDNKGICDVRNFVKPDISSEFDYTDVNSHHLWTAFAIEYREVWDGETSNPFEADMLYDCVPNPQFTDGDFSEGFTDWNQQIDGDWTEPFSAVAGNMQVTFAPNGYAQSQLLYQDLQLKAGNKYEVGFSASSTLAYDRLIVLGIDTLSGNIFTLSSPVYINENTSITFYPNLDLDKIAFGFLGSYDASTVTIGSVNLTVNDGVQSPCEYSSFTNYGTKQFQDSLGGNFGDYVLNSTDAYVTPKMLTHFDKFTLFPNGTKSTDGTILEGFKNYINAIIPSSTFALSDQNDSLYLEFNTFKDGDTVQVAERVKVDNTNDGVYSVNLDSLGLIEDFDYGYCQFIIIPANTLTDGDNGTYEDATPSNWNITPNGICTIIASDSVDGKLVGVFDTVASSLIPTVYDAGLFSSEIKTIIGKTYVIESDVYVDVSQFEPRQRNGNSGIFLGVEGINDNDLSYTDFNTPADFSPVVSGKIKTTFVATQTTHRIQLRNAIYVVIDSATGGNWKLDNTTFKGPIDYISEQKEISISNECKGYKTNTLRWLNDLGGWEVWKFTQYETSNESFKRNEIKRDIFADFDSEFINGETQYDTISISSRKKVTLRSQLLTANEAKEIGKLQRSIKVQIAIPNGFANVTNKPLFKWQTVSIKGGSFVLLDEKEDMHEISFDVELPDTLIQEL